MAINSPFRYPGGKFYARKLILEYVLDRPVYVEPFAGGGSIFFAKEKARVNWLNDIDEELVNCYLVIRDRPYELIDKLAGEPATKERHTYYKNHYQPQSDLERATRWFYLNRTSYSGIMKPESCYWGYGEKYSMRPENWPRNILRTSQKLQNVKLTSWDFERVMWEIPNNAFVFVDPPYYSARQDNFYTHHFTQEDHFRLKNTLRANSDRFQFLLTYDDVPKIREMYAWANAIDGKEWNYTVGRTDDQKKPKPGQEKKKKKVKGSRYKGQEIFVTNFDRDSQNHRDDRIGDRSYQLSLPLQTN